MSEFGPRSRRTKRSWKRRRLSAFRLYHLYAPGDLPTRPDERAIRISSGVSVASFKSPLLATRSPHPRGEFSVLASLGFPPLARFFHPERLALGDDEHVVVEQPVEQADGR
jgi:hypothetical protein